MGTVGCRSIDNESLRAVVLDLYGRPDANSTVSCQPIPAGLRSWEPYILLQPLRKTILHVKLHRKSKFQFSFLLRFGDRDDVKLKSVGNELSVGTLPIAKVAVMGSSNPNASVSSRGIETQNTSPLNSMQFRFRRNHDQTAPTRKPHKKRLPCAFRLISQTSPGPWFPSSGSFPQHPRLFVSRP